MIGVTIDYNMSTYEVNGKQYLVVSAMGSYNVATKDHSKD